MSIGKKFLDRVLNEAKKDVDGFKDDFDITTLPAEHPALSSMPMPMARQVVQLYHLMGVSADTLGLKPTQVREAAIGIAEQMRTNRPLRVAAQRLFSLLASSKGFSKSKELEEATASMSPEDDLMLRGGMVVKQMEAVLAALGLPASVLKKSMNADQNSLEETSEILRSGAGHSRFSVLASELGVDLASIGQSVKVRESVDPAGQQQSEFEVASAALLNALGIDVNRLPSSTRQKMKRVEMGDRAIAGKGSMVLTMMQRLTDRLNKQGKGLQ